MAKQAHNAMQIAHYILQKCIRDKQPISNLQLQKILYTIQRTGLQQKEVWLNATFEARQVSPVIPHVYEKFAALGAFPIDSLPRGEYTVDRDFRKIIDPIIDCTRALPPWDFVEEIMYTGSAWDRVYANGAGVSEEIPNELIAQYG